MKSLTGSVVRDQLFFMLGFGLLMGLIFPFFSLWLLKLPASRVLTPLYFSMCVLAGLIVGLCNYFIFRGVVYRFLSNLAARMQLFSEKLERHRNSPAEGSCRMEDCLVDASSADILGKISGDFNNLISSVANFVEVERTTNSFLDRLKRDLKLEEVARVVLEAFSEYFGGQGSFLLVLERGEMRLVKSQSVEINREQIQEAYWLELMKQEWPVVVSGIEGEAIHLHIGVGLLDPRHIALIPLKYRNEEVGVCGLLSREPFKRGFAAPEARNFIMQATPFIYNAMIMKRLEVMAAIDELTGVLNRRFGLRRMTEEFERSKRYRMPLSVAMVDLDHFKKINDTYGHQAGDFVLKTLAGLFAQNIRVSDLVIRFGGEEFLLVFNGASAVDAYQIMEKLRNKAETLRLQYGSFDLKITLSAGVASFPSDKVSDLPGLIHQADAALYI
ncbi:MAG: sensor domain-containing diguanylate cyclase [Candidatus Saccharicenans sp.]|nr:sensor domain-containing diguanylate cyclase [Candidatus Saccharicenans sp.]MDI6849939.1 sensor domain-containing diguanylate cyclase [Candidatus Saccharicenans sp.]